MLSRDLAGLYGLRPKDLIQVIRRNKNRFPQDFAFKLTRAEAAWIREQSLLYFRGRFFKHPPYAFTKAGVAMLTCVLQKERAIRLNLRLMRGVAGWLTSLPEDLREMC